MSTSVELAVPGKSQESLLKQLGVLEGEIAAVSEFLSIELPEAGAYANAHYVLERFVFHAERVTSLAAPGGDHTDPNCQRLLAFGDVLFTEDPDRPVQISTSILGPKMQPLPTRFKNGEIQQRHSSLLGEMMEQALNIFTNSHRDDQDARELCENMLEDQIPQYAQNWQEL
jgi:hypothetical protein